ncbi:uncharacterized protein NPIL_704221 [Nephila pilipes]|uniref:Uncharacterized protein n=1 Tax=Nephila pilipes TaxID=299642 RepID=A0A8X6TU85_NEPPI|nr:uncharacterized protein NPIL_704221 [Nephila pilipes]
METLASESATGTGSAREASRRLGVPPYSIRNILHGVLNQYLYKLQSCHELLPSDTVERETFAMWALSKIDQDSSWVSDDEQMKLIFRYTLTLISITLASG